MSISRRTFFASLLGASAAVTVAPAAGHASISDPAVEVFGAVRILPEPEGPTVLNDANHTPYGLTSVEITTTGYLQINHTDLLEVGFASGNADEYLTNKGITIGISQGFAYARLAFYSSKLGRTLNLNNASDYDSIAASTSNVWFYARSTD